MESILIYPKDKNEFEFLNEMLKRMKIDSEILSQEDEDLALGKAIEEGMKTKDVPKSRIIEALKK
jgi:hypothetical protein